MPVTSDLIDQPIKETTVFGTQPKYSKPVRILNDNSVFYKGLFGMIFCIIPGGIIGLVLIKLAMEQSHEALTQYQRNPQMYLESSINKIRNGRKMSIIGLIIFALEIIAFIIYTSV